jgi:hypothetical protein
MEGPRKRSGPATTGPPRTVLSASTTYTPGPGAHGVAAGTRGGRLPPGGPERDTTRTLAPVTYVDA